MNSHGRENRDLFQNIDTNRHRMNMEGSLGDHIMNLCSHLLVYSAELRKSESTTAAAAAISTS